jgi:hypothetical protein
MTRTTTMATSRSTTTSTDELPSLECILIFVFSPFLYVCEFPFFCVCRVLHFSSIFRRIFSLTCLGTRRLAFTKPRLILFPAFCVLTFCSS